MYQLVLLVCLLALSGCREETALSSWPGPYYGGFDTAMTIDPGDDLNPNECPPGTDPQQCRSVHGNPLDHLLMKLGINAEGKLTIAFFRNQDDYEADHPMYLSSGCKTSLGPATTQRLHRVDQALDETQVVATASFPLVFGNRMLACTNSARFSAESNPSMELALQLNPVTGARAITITMEKTRRDGDYLYVKKDGEKVPVKLDLRYVGTDDSEARRLCAADDKTLLENNDRYRGVCVMTGRKKWSIALPISLYGPGVTAFWGSTRSPRWNRTSGEPDIVSYHSAVFLPVQFEPGENSLTE